jgi:Protein of unknown function (DUF2950)
MTDGFAVVPYPASYGESGIMTFMVNQDGLIFEKDLGQATGQVAAAMSGFNPDQAFAKQENEKKVKAAPV